MVFIRVVGRTDTNITGQSPERHNFQYNGSTVTSVNKAKSLRQ